MLGRTGRHLKATSVRDAWKRFTRALEPPYPLNQVLLTALDTLAELVPGDAFYAYLAPTPNDGLKLRVTRTATGSPQVGPNYAGLVVGAPVRQVPLDLPAWDVPPGTVAVREDGSFVEIRMGTRLAFVIARPPRRPLSPEERQRAEEWGTLVEPVVALAQYVKTVEDDADPAAQTVQRRAFELAMQVDRMTQLLCDLGADALKANVGYLAVHPAEGKPRLLWQLGNPAGIQQAFLARDVALKYQERHYLVWTGPHLPARAKALGLSSLVLVPLPLGGSAMGTLVYGSPVTLTPTKNLVNVLTNLNQSLRLTIRGRQQAEAVTRLYVRILLATADLLDNADPFNVGHHQKVAEVAARIARQLGRPDSEVQALYLAGRLHDIGMVAVSLDLPLTKGTLSEQQRQIIRQHPAVGADLVGGLRTDIVPEATERAIREHHEAWDGHGYPKGLAGSEISLEGRILALAEQFVARLAARSYRPGLSLPQALYQMDRLRNTALDPAVVDALLALYRQAGITPQAPTGTLT